MNYPYRRGGPLTGADRTVAATRTRTPPVSRVAATATVPPPIAANAAAQPASRSRNDVESWVEVDSQPSSSSVSSIAEEIVITGLRVGYNASGPNGAAMPVVPQRRRRLLQQVEAEAAAAASAPERRVTNTGSAGAPVARPTGGSQEGYDETESEEDRLMASSDEHVHVRRPPTPPQPFAQLRLQQQQRQQQQQRAVASDGDDEDDDDDGTALGPPSSGPPTFRPQPNVFSHPPTLLQQHQQQYSFQRPQLQQNRSAPAPPHAHLATPYSRQASAALSQRAGSRATSRGAGSPPFLAPAVSTGPSGPSSGPSGPSEPAHRDDHDAVLRASLTTLLSCAAAARGLPKTKESGASYGESSALSPGVRPSTQPMDLCLVPESELMEEEASATLVSRPAFQRSAPSQPQQPQQQQQQQQPPAAGVSAASRTTSRVNARSGARSTTSGLRGPSSRVSAVSATSSMSRSRRSVAGAGAGRAQRSIKKKRAVTVVEGEATTTFLTPTLMTWVVSAGMVVLVSVVGFGAGYVLGREVGRQEAVSDVFGNGPAPNTTSCSHEIMRSSTGSSLRRFRWGSISRSVAA